MKSILSGYFRNEKILVLDRAFLGLYIAFKTIKEATKKNKIIFTSMTCPSPVFAAVLAGCEPVFVDINMSNYLMDFMQVKMILENDQNVAAVVYIYIFGHVSEDVYALRELTAKANVYLIEDVAQAFGSEICGQAAGTIGDLSVFSFGYSKQIDAGGGGALMLNSDNFSIDTFSQQLNNVVRFEPSAALAKKYHQDFYSIRLQGLENSQTYRRYADFPFQYRQLYFKKISVDWGIAKTKLSMFVTHKEKARRNTKAATYHRAFSAKKFHDKLFLPVLNDGVCIYRYTFLAKDREDAARLSGFLRDHGVHCSNLYIPISRIYHDEGFPKAVDFAKRVINLWVDDLADDQYIEKTIQLMNKFFR